MGYKRLDGVLRGDRGLQGLRGGYKGVEGGYRVLQVVPRGLQGVTGGYKGL